MQRIRLPHGEWFLDPSRQLGATGGFGAVFAGSAPGFGELAVKRLHLSVGDAAHRELVVAERLRDRALSHVMPFLDAGQDSDSEAYYTVMPMADGTLQDRLDSTGPFTENDALTVLWQIVTGLGEVRDLVHRDLKPSNVLFHEGRWKIGDFGIARFVEESTSLNTLQGCLSAEYAAPEQWRLEDVTAATDTYALGCIAYALLTGRPPFSGRTDELRRQHLESTPPPLPNVSVEVGHLVSLTLRKIPVARMSQQRLAERLQRLRSRDPSMIAPATAGFAALVGAAAQHARQKAESEAIEAEVQRQRVERTALARDAREQLHEIVARLFNRISEAVADCHRGRGGDIERLHVGGALLEVNFLSELVISKEKFRLSSWDVVTGARMGVEQARPRYDWNVSLWYRRRNDSTDYRWYEVAYRAGVFYESTRFEPFALNPGEADLAEDSAMRAVSVAYGPHDIEENFEQYCDRWARLLAAASSGELRYPPNYSLVT